MPEPTKQTLFTVARGRKAISSYVVDRDEACVELRRIENDVRAAMLKPDVYLATVSKTMSYGEPVEVAS